MILDLTSYRAKLIVTRSLNGSTSHLARKMKLAYAEANTLMQQLQRDKVVSAPDHLGRRIVLLEGKQ